MQSKEWRVDGGRTNRIWRPVAGPIRGCYDLQWLATHSIFSRCSAFVKCSRENAINVLTSWLFFKLWKGLFKSQQNTRDSSVMRSCIFRALTIFLYLAQCTCMQCKLFFKFFLNFEMEVFEQYHTNLHGILCQTIFDHPHSRWWIGSNA